MSSGTNSQVKIDNCQLDCVYPCDEASEQSARLYVRITNQFVPNSIDIVTNDWKDAKLTEII